MNSCSSLVLLSHTVNLLYRLGVPEPLHTNPEKKVVLPHIYDLESPIQDQEEKCFDVTSHIATPCTVLDYDMGGTCGAHFVETADCKGIFKPLAGEGSEGDSACTCLKADESGSVVTPLKRGVTFGETVVKEIAAYVLGAAFDVPATRGITTLINGQAVYGSFQAFAPHSCSAEDMGPSAFSIDEVQKVGILDIRLLNLDRHLNNILVNTQEGSSRLIPIDHGYILPVYHDMSDVYFGWTYWKQCKEGWSQKSRAVIEAMNPFQDAEVLSQMGISSDSILPSVLATLLLQHAVKNEISLYRLAAFIQSDMQSDEISGFEIAVKEAVSSIESTDYEALFDWSAQLPHKHWNQLVQQFFTHANLV